MKTYHKHLAGKPSSYETDGKTTCIDCQLRMEIPARTRHVFRSYEECAHVWASQTLGYGNYSSLYFQGRSIYSYGSHFEIARFIAPDTVLYTVRHYSNTTAKHKWAVREALKGRTVYELQSFDDMNANADYFIEQINDSVKVIKTGRTSFDLRLASLAEFQSDAKIFLDKFGKTVSADKKKALRKLIRTVFFTAAEIKVMHEKEARNEESQKRAAETKKRNDVLREAERRARWAAEDIARKEASRIQDESAAHVEAIAESLEETWEDEIAAGLRLAWLAGDKRGEVPYGETLLRVIDGEIQTSHNAYVPVEDAKRLWAKLQAREDITGFEIGHYTVTGIHDKKLVIGCHRIPLIEIARMSKILNLTTQLEVI